MERQQEGRMLLRDETATGRAVLTGGTERGSAMLTDGMGQEGSVDRLNDDRQEGVDIGKATGKKDIVTKKKWKGNSKEGQCY
jgi:hypothetical protein